MHALNEITMIRTWLNQLTDCRSNHLARRLGVWLGLAFVILYLYSVGNIVIAPGTDVTFGRPYPQPPLCPIGGQKCGSRSLLLYGSRSLLSIQFIPLRCSSRFPMSCWRFCSAPLWR